jgi:hypothetical protein
MKFNMISRIGCAGKIKIKFGHCHASDTCIESLVFLKNDNIIILNTRIVFSKYQALYAWPYGHGRTHPYNMLIFCALASQYSHCFPISFHPAGAADPTYPVNFNWN